ncbi:MAG: phytanoyl-CoA dioxygenase family protein [Pseudomonadota bacterium]
MDYNQGHVTSESIPQDIEIPTALIHEDADTQASQALNWSVNEIEFFKINGYILKRGVIQDETLFTQVIDHLWANVPRDVIQRDNPDTWFNKPHERWTQEDHEKVGLLAHGNWKMRSRGPHGIGTEPFLVEKIANHPNLLKLVEGLIGKPLKPVQRVRGVYAVLPKPSHARGRYGPHADYAAGQLGAMVIVDKMPAGSGGFTVWPGSHQHLHPHWDTCLGSAISDEKREGYRQARNDVLREVTPVETAGMPGDVIFWHHRLLHSVGINNTADWEQPLVRVIVPCDYQRGDMTFYDDLEYGPGPDFQWWLDTRNFREDEPPTATNLWRHWAI